MKPSMSLMSSVVCFHECQTGSMNSRSKDGQFCQRDIGTRDDCEGIM